MHVLGTRKTESLSQGQGLESDARFFLHGKGVQVAKSNFGPALGRGKKHRFDVGSIVRCRPTNIKRPCMADGTMFPKGEGHDGFSFEAVMYIVKKIAITTRDMLWRDEVEMPVYAAQIIPSVDIQPVNCFNDYLGYHYIVRDDCLSQTTKEKKIQALGAYGYEGKKLNSSKMRQVEDEIIREALIGGSRYEPGDR